MVYVYLILNSLLESTINITEGHFSRIEIGEFSLAEKVLPQSCKRYCEISTKKWSLLGLGGYEMLCESRKPPRVGIIYMFTDQFYCYCQEATTTCSIGRMRQDWQLSPLTYPEVLFTLLIIHDACKWCFLDVYLDKNLVETVFIREPEAFLS